MTVSKRDTARFPASGLMLLTLLAFLVSPLGIAIEAIVAIAIVAAVVLYMAKRRATRTPLAGMSGPTPTPGFGPGPAPAPATP